MSSLVIPRWKRNLEILTVILILGILAMSGIIYYSLIPIKQEVSRLENKVDELEAKLDELELKIDELEVKIDEIELKLEPKVYRPTEFESNGDIVAMHYWLRQDGHYAEWTFTGLNITGPFTIHFALAVHHTISGWPSFGDIEAIVTYNEKTMETMIRLTDRYYHVWHNIYLGDPLYVPSTGLVTDVTVRIIWRGWDVWPPVNPGPDGLPEHFGIHMVDWADYCWIRIP